MVNLSTEELKRNFISDEICKRIVGPGFAQDIYLTSANAEDEILVERPQIVYTSGILFPNPDNPSTVKTSSANIPQHLDDDEDIDTFIIKPIMNGINVDNDDESSEGNDVIEGLGEDAEAKGHHPKSGEIEESLSDERAGFNPDRIGLITCLNADASTIPVKIKYGRYHLIPEKDWQTEVKIALDNRCPYSTLKAAFDYYDKSAQQLLNTLGVNSVYDLFHIDNSCVPATISPKRELAIKIPLANNQEKKKYIYPSDFPATLRNIAAAKLCKVINEGGSVELSDISWNDFLNQVKFFDSLKGIQEFVNNQKWSSLEKSIKYDSATNKISLVFGSHNCGEVNIARYLYEHDAVKEYVLRNLLEYRFFKREQHSIDVDIDLSQECSKEIGDSLVLHWKPFNYSKKPNVKYLRVLLQNCTKVDKSSGKIPHIFQAEIYLDGKDIITYSEPRLSSIDDEFNTNEVLYSDELTYGKGVNCAVEWNLSDGKPLYVKTTYTPKTHVRSFSTQMDDTNITEVCNVHNLSVWGKPDSEIIDGLRKFALGYNNWMGQQRHIANGDLSLADVLNKQQEFIDRFNDNIDYLSKNDRAFKCFRMANTAMYIQMLLGRDQNFKDKGKDKSKFTNNFSYDDCWDYFKDKRSNVAPAYYPFQLAFLVMNIKSTFEANDPYRTDNVDLIWFPTGGGKTEAYLALTALTIAERRTCGHQNTDGVSVIMRYTLRLLTAQQFERASYLICALEYLRAYFNNQKDPNYSLGMSDITIGMWIGKATSPNKLVDLYNEDKFREFYNALQRRNPAITPELNPFPVVYCPWCGCNLVGDDWTCGYSRSRTNRPADTCLNANCHFHRGIPLYYIDEQLYNNPPTLLFATVDKFAQLNTRTAGQLLGVGKNTRKPDLIIQDELHLISGPLGSIVGLFETLVEELSTEKDCNGNIIRKPKIIASTATTRNTKLLGKQLYARNIISFPASGVRYSDNFFSHILGADKSLRMYMGLAPTGHTAAELEIRAIASELVAKEKLITEWLKSKGVSLNNRAAIISELTSHGKLIKELDLYWTQVLYYMNLKSLGRTHSRISQEIKATLENMKRFTESYPELSFILDGFYVRNTEFTSRQNSAQIKHLLIKADEATQISESQPNLWKVESQMDIVQATNMISVGIDIERWNVLMMVGQPLTTAEYIQASSRSGRRHKGLVVNLYNPIRARELSYYENYTSYHQVFYKFVEPLSATTFTEMTLDKLILNLYVGYMVLLLNKSKVGDVSNTDKDQFIEWLQNRADSAGSTCIGSSIQLIVDKIFNNLQQLRNNRFAELNTRNGLLPNAQLSNLMKSLREIEPNTYLKYE